MVANFVKNPFVSPAPNFPHYNPSVSALVELAFDENVQPNVHFSCSALWDQILL